MFIGAAANEGVLANFFNSLLSKKTGVPGSPGTPGAAAGAGSQGSAKKTGKFFLFQPFSTIETGESHEKLPHMGYISPPKSKESNE